MRVLAANPLTRGDPGDPRLFRYAVETAERDNLGLKVISVGGVLSVDDAKHYFDAGAYAVMMGGAPMFIPDLAVRFKELHPEW